MAKNTDKLSTISVATNPTLAQLVAVPGFKGKPGAVVDQLLQDALKRRFQSTGAATGTQRQVQREAIQALTSPVVDVARESRAYAGELSFEIELRGAHYSGLTNQEILDLFIKHGRDFTADTSQLRRHVEESLLNGFKGKRWDDDTAAEIAAEAILEWIVSRVEDERRDTFIPALTPDYLRRKRAKGEDTRVGVKKGRFLKALKKARVNIDF